MKLVRQIADKSGFTKNDNADPPLRPRRLLRLLHEGSDGVGEGQRWNHTAKNVRKGMHAKQDWVPKGLEGVSHPVDVDPDRPPRHQRRSRSTAVTSRTQQAKRRGRSPSTVLKREDRWLGQ